jgi:hypothetical protein
VKLPFELQDPRGLWLLAALAPLIALYVLKIQRKRVPVASTWLWAAARRDLLARSPWKRLVPQIPLLLQLLALALLALALARPATRHKAILGDHVAVILDTSASMGVVDPTTRQRRIEQAKTAAWEALAALSPGADAILLEASRTPRVVAPLDRDIKRLQAALDPLPARDVEGDLGAAVALAMDRLRQLGGERRILVFTDGNLAHGDTLQAPGVPLEIYTVGSPAENAAIVRVDVRSGVDPTSREEEVQAFALVANYGTRPRDLFVTLRLVGATEPLASRRLLVPPGDRQPVVLAFRPSAGDRLKGLLVELSPRDAMAADDVAYARVPPGQKQPVVLASETGSAWLERALASDPLVDLWKGKPAEVAQAKGTEGALFVFDGHCPGALPSGDFLVVNPPEGPCLGVQVGAAVKAPSITSWSHGDARLRFLTLDGVHVATARSLRVDGASQALIRAQQEVLAADASAPGRSGTILGFDVGESDWPLKASFVLFIRNTLELARAHRAQGVSAAVAGEPVRVPVPADVKQVEALAPGSREPVVLPAREGLVVLSETQKAGHYLVSWQGARPGQLLVPVNLTSERESDLRTKPLDLGREGASVSSAAQLADAHTDWSYLIAALGLLFLVLDVYWLTRKPSPRPAAPLRPERQP